jgi:hypothetical protein
MAAVERRQRVIGGRGPGYPRRGAGWPERTDHAGQRCATSAQSRRPGSLPVPAGRPNHPAGLPCDWASNSYPASWISGVSQDAARRSDVLISYNNFCVPIGGGTPRAEGLGLAGYDPATSTLDSQATVFTPAGPQPLAGPELLGSPVFSGGYLYLFAAHCADDYELTCLPSSDNAVYLARMGADPCAWDTAADYQWDAGPMGWTPAVSAAASIVPGATPLAACTSDFSALGQGLVLIAQTGSTGASTVYEAPRPTGPWTEKTSGTVPCTVEGDSLCRAIIGHPELSTSRELLLSYFNPAAAPAHYPAGGV